MTATAPADPTAGIERLRILVTGASGFIGTRLVHRLASLRCPVVAMVRPTSNRAALAGVPGLRFAVADLDTGHGVAAAVDGVDVVVHLAGLVKAWRAGDFWRGNVQATERLGAAMAATGSVPRLVLCSSLAAAGPSRPGEPRDESAPARPVSAYGRSKLAAESAVRTRADRIPTVVLRPPVVYGPGDHDFLPSFLPMARYGLFPRPRAPEREFSFVHVDDLCAALIAATLRGQTMCGQTPRARTRCPDPADTGVYFVSDGRVYGWREFCTALARAVGRDRARTVPVPAAVVHATGWLCDLAAACGVNGLTMNRDRAHEINQLAWTCDPGRAREQLGFAPRYQLSDGLAQAIGWYRDRGLLRWAGPAVTASES